MGLYDRDYMKSEAWRRRYDRDYMKSEARRRNEYYAQESNLSYTNKAKERKSTLLVTLFIVTIFLIASAYYYYSEHSTGDFIDAVKSFLKKFSANFSTSNVNLIFVVAQNYKFDTETIDPQENNWYNLLVAAQYLKEWNSTDINKAQKVTAADLYKHTWKYIGKLVRLTIEVLMPEELSPSESVSKLLNPGGPSTVILAKIDVGGAGDAIQYHYGGPFEGFDAGDKVEICGYVIGKVRNTNRLGGTCYNIIIAGKYIKKIE